ncbi:zinc-ribbon domain-containing protein [Lentzea sp. BCCO 10_0856]|uniref:Zinc-ribbon domain-containing protein n=1 Tax=Lentzea miocenica TaxID=3095431 RepID=A0ABU4TCG3_9PSEU|nr:zinc-ribbon domain-containing protein [Lentzea sp. BCCO 10_0856]MDX8035871.1 zinc-ribbon domain-containing protein [Lentzea sp. BCCO 10_0856]
MNVVLGSKIPTTRDQDLQSVGGRSAGGAYFEFGAMQHLHQFGVFHLMTGAKTQLCSTNECMNPAAFNTKTRPTWCGDCIDGFTRAGGLEPLEPFAGVRAWRLTECPVCGVRAHYRFEYIQDKNAAGEKVCRGCHWMSWAGLHRTAPWQEFDRATLESLRRGSLEQVAWADRLERFAAYVEEHGFDLVASNAAANSDGPVVTRCRACQKRSVDRISDVGFGCTCSRNTRSTNPAGGTRGRVLLIESDSPGLRWWDSERNDEATLRTVTVAAVRKCHWKCPECGLRFQAKVNDMAAGPTCPDCAARSREDWKRDYERWQITPVADVPELAAAWADEAAPSSVMVAGDGAAPRFRCSQGHYPRISPLTFLEGGCPHCRAAHTVVSGKRWLADTLPEIASQWHPERNGKLTPENVVWDSKRVVWWRAVCCGHEWQESVRDRDKYKRLRCPNCKTILGSLAWHDPGLAAEWAPQNPVTAWQVRPTAATSFAPLWICATDPAHVWRAPLSSRSSGAECPDCREHGKSRVELEHHAAALALLGTARSGVTLRDKAFTSRKTWTADISVDIDGQLLVIEYDGAYWHAAPAKVLVDERKSQDLLAAGYLVVRLREDSLPPLAVADPRYLEIRVYSAAPRPHVVMEGIREWVRGLVSSAR